MLSRLWKSETGTSIIELGLIMPILLMLSLGSIDLARGFAARLDLEQAAQATTDLALARLPRDRNDTAYLIAEANRAAGAGATPTVQLILKCNGASQSRFDNDCPVAGQIRARFVQVSIARPYTPMFEWGALVGRSVIPATITLTGDSIVRIQ